ncbi:hypothetical protein K2173_002116 [Erythroxylum novogranatense]|uniref:GDSL esterase/lipase n=1 Tax=Erythroxylum novogranatense TaxID=1862640 RepID=A0AAV8SQC0_9ROSI|nr:hypothetical protein K2173_002116 [Erythroxylum novogranatense]
MDTRQKLVFTFFCYSILFLLSGNIGVDGSSSSSQHHRRHHHHARRHLFNHKPSKLFVFGDSYADTGNNRKSLGNSWNIPYGITFPGKPAGRYSDGRVLTDFLARFIGTRSPIAYRWRKLGIKLLKYGVNFAFGGTGVFDTPAPYPNMTTQIDFFEEMIKLKIFSPMDLKDSAALVSVVGNDYAAFVARNSSIPALEEFISQVINQISLNLKRISDLGVKRIAVTSLQPLGCLPRSTVESSFRQCNDTDNLLVEVHNSFLQQAVTNLKADSNTTTIVILDLYSAFLSVLKNKGDHPEISKFTTPLRPCCIGVSTESSCGSVDANGTKLYRVCRNPEFAFFWDFYHPTQAGWQAVYTTLKSNFHQLEGKIH